MKLFKPIINKKKYSKLVGPIIERFLMTYYFLPIFEVIKPVYEFYNDSDIVLNAIRANRIQYVDGKFYGKFDAELSKELIKLGAKWNNHTKTFDIARSKLSMELLGVIGSASVYTMTLQKALLDVLSTLTIEDKMPELAKWLEVPLDTTLEDLDGQSYNVFFKSQMPKVDRKPGKLREQFRKDISVSPDKEVITETKLEEKQKQQVYERAKLPEFQRELLKKEYTEDLSLRIKGFTYNEIIKLRKIVEQNTFYGLKNQSLVQAIQKEFKTTLNKAKFLANNETSIFIAKYRKAKSLELGLIEYKWIGLDDEKERPMHKLLNNLIFRYDEPPVVNAKGDRKNPGEDYNCRCTAMSVLPWAKSKIQEYNGKVKYARGIMPDLQSSTMKRKGN